MIRLIVAGATGQTGAVVAKAAQNSDQCEVLVGISRVLSMGGDVPTVKRVKDAPDADAVVDFSTPAACAEIAQDCAARAIPLVTGTTGLSDEQQAIIQAASQSIPIVQSGNFSLGVNALMALVEKAARALEGFDIEVTEAHHRSKVDSPSGTALMLGEAAAHGRGTTLTEKAVFERHGQVGPRKEGDIGFSVVRGGGVVGDHDVKFLADSEVVTISHRAIDRGLFAQGALRAALWIKGQKPGLYSMRDVLGLD